jgi:hypothetical protein
VRRAYGIGAIVLTGAALFAFAALHEQLAGNEPAVARPAATAPAAPRPELAEPKVTEEPPQVAAAPQPETPNSTGSAPSRAETELIALEEEALRRIDVTPVLEDAGVDVSALKRRPDAAEILRHVAGDEVLARGYMRRHFGAQVYPYGYPVEQAVRDARLAAENQVAQLNTRARIESLTEELDRDEVGIPEPEVYPESSGRIWVAPDPSQTGGETADAR